MSDAAGWNSPAYYPTIQFGDIDKDGLDEMVARDAPGVHTWRYNSVSRTWDEAGAVLPVSTADCVDASCYSTFQVGDLTGEGAADLVYRDKNGLHMFSWNNTPSQPKYLY